MSSDGPKRSSKLVFKGEKPKKRKRKERAHEDGDEDEGTGDAQAWVQPEVPAEVLGPTFIVHPTGEGQPPICIAYDSTRDRLAFPIVPHPSTSKQLPSSPPSPTVPLDVDPSPSASASASTSLSTANLPLTSLVPTEVQHVWVITRLAGSETINLRSPSGKFLSCDEHGLVSADREARGPQEEWSVEILPPSAGSSARTSATGMVAFKNMYDKYLGIDEVAGGQLALRGDADEVGSSERFFVRVQSGYKKKAHEEERQKKLAAKEEEYGRVDEAQINSKFQLWGAGKRVVSQDDTRELKKARKDGRLNEALLERRAKLKSDRFC